MKQRERERNGKREKEREMNRETQRLRVRETLPETSPVPDSAQLPHRLPRSGPCARYLAEGWIRHGRVGGRVGRIPEQSVPSIQTQPQPPPLVHRGLASGGGAH